VSNDKGHHARFGNLMVRAGQQLARTIDVSIVQSQEMANKLAGVKHVYIAPHEVDLDLFQPVARAEACRALGLDPAKKHLLFAANPQIPVKNFPFAKAVADQLLLRDPALEFVVVYQEPQARLALYMNACDALIFPSFQEGSPNIVKQAMACNLPIVATPVGDVREMIGRTPGCFVCERDVSPFVTSLSEVLRNCQRTQGREHIRHFALPIVARRIIQVYEETLARRGSRQRPVRQRSVGIGRFGD
jgi:hypothetical protein